ncbi:MAG: DUF1934 domain-containing protein [Oscillospiraceae bacterium]|nr:DUF1934 domain-containing protein [Oscillospiraceae bacterium]
MKKDVLIRIKDRQRSAFESEGVDITTAGCFKGSPMDYKIEFPECFDGGNVCNTVLHVKDKRCVTMLRKGAYYSELIIEQDKRHSCHYITPYGDFMVGIYAKSVNSDMDENGGMLKMKYTVDYDSGYAAENEITVKVNSYN